MLVISWIWSGKGDKVRIRLDAKETGDGEQRVPLHSSHVCMALSFMAIHHLCPSKIDFARLWQKIN